MNNLSANKNRTISLCITLLLLGCVIFGAILPVSAASYPKPTNKVADEAGVLSESTIRSIKNTNESLAADVGASIAVCTVKTTGSTPINEYAAALFKEWKLGEGVLLVIATEDDNYYFIQSVGVDKIITNDVLADVRDKYLESDFAAGNIDRGVFKTVTSLSSHLVNGLEDAADSTDEDKTTEDGEEKENKGTTAGGVIVGFFKFILILVLIVVVLFAALFVAAIFNDDAAAIFQFIWQNVILRKQSKTYSMPREYYDDRLYGNAQTRNRPQNRSNANRRPQNLPPRQDQPRLREPQMRNQAPRGNYDQRPPQNRYYNADGTPRRQNQNQYDQYNQYNQYPQNRQGNYRQGQQPQGNYRQAPTQSRPRPQSQQYDGEETRAFTIPGRGQNN